jgi:hypothetical protein
MQSKYDVDFKKNESPNLLEHIEINLAKQPGIVRNNNESFVTLQNFNKETPKPDSNEASIVRASSYLQ